MPTALFVEVDELVLTADAEGVEMEVAIEEDGDAINVWLASIERTHGRPGAGARALERLMEICSDHEVPIEGAIEPPNPRLEEYYSMHGFDIERHGSRTIITRTP